MNYAVGLFKSKIYSTLKPSCCVFLMLRQKENLDYDLGLQSLDN